MGDFNRFNKAIDEIEEVLRDLSGGDVLAIVAHLIADRLARNLCEGAGSDYEVHKVMAREQCFRLLARAVANYPDEGRPS